MEATVAVELTVVVMVQDDAAAQAAAEVLNYEYDVVEMTFEEVG